MALKFRRGTTAQQSGSLAFGEPYVNTTLGTLLIGGPNGDIVLSTTGTGSTGTFGAISGSGLDITGNARIGGNLTLGGNITIGDATTDVVNVVANLSSSLIPSETNVFDLGSANKIWRDLYISTGSIKFVAGTTVAKELTLATILGLESATGSNNVAISNLNSFTSSINSTIKGQLNVNHVISGSSQVTLSDVNGFTAYSGSVYTRLLLEKDRIDAILSASSADKDSFAEIVELINSVDTSNDSTFAAFYTASNGRLNNLESTSASLLIETTNLEAFSASALTRLAVLEVETSNLEIFSGSQLSKDTTLATYTGSVETRFTEIGIVTASLILSASAAKTTNDSQGVSITNLNTTTASLNTSVSNINTFSASALTRLTALEVETSNLETFSASVLTRLTEVGVVTGSLIASASTAKTTNDSQGVSITNLNTFSASTLTRLTALEVETANLETFSSSALTRLGVLEVETANLEVFTSSQETKNSTLATYTGSVENRLNTLGSLSGSFARTNSANTFNGNQIVSGSLTVTQDLIVLGSSSIQHVSSSTLNIGTNLITVAVNQPSVRFGGLAVIDSGSSGGSGSFLYDAVQDEFIFVHRGDGTNITSSHFLLGPETYNNLGNESYIGQHRIIKGSGNEHITVSNIFDDGTTISLGSNVVVTGSITVSGTVDGVDVSVLNSNINSFSSSTLTRLTALEVETANLEAFSSSALTRLTALEVETANLEAFTSSINTTIKTRLNAETVISGSSQVAHDSTTGYSANRHVDHTAVSITAGSGLTGGGDISTTRTISIATGGVTNDMLAGSIANAKLANSSITIGGTSVSLGGSITLTTITGGSGIVSGSSQIDHNATTNYSANRHIDHTAVSITAGSGLTGGGDISATRTISIANSGVTNDMLAGSIANSKLTNSTISGISLGSNLAALTIGSGLSGTSYNGSGAVTITNTGVRSIAAGTGVSVSATTGDNCTISIGQSVATSANVQFNSLGIGMAASNTAGRIDATNDIVAYSSSDIRFKENIKPIENPIEKIRKISGNTYDWKEENKIHHGYEGNDVGVIAQEIEAVLPQLVQTRESGYKAVKYDKLVALLIEGIKEQQLQIEKLQIEVSNLKIQKGL